MNALPPIGPKDKFTPELRILAASLLSMVVILLGAKYFGPKPRATLPQQNQAAQTAGPVAGTPSNAASNSTPTSNAGPAGPSATLSAAPATVAITSDSQERTFVVENDLYRVEFSNRGAVVKSWQLKKYKDDSKPQKLLDVVHPKAAEQTGGWPFSMVFDDPQLQNAANNGLYKISSDKASLQAPADVTFTWSDGHLQVSKTFHFDHSYVVK